MRLLRRAHTRKGRTIAVLGCVVPVRVTPLRQAGNGSCGVGGCGAGARHPHTAGRQQQLRRRGAWCRSASPLRWAGIGWRCGVAGLVVRVCCNGGADDLLKVGGGTDGDGSLLGGGSRGLPCPG
jgi:hypothetical protein